MKFRGQCWDDLLVMAFIRSDRQTPKDERAGDDLALVLLLIAVVALQLLSLWAGAPLVAVLLLPAGLLTHARMAVARRGLGTVSGALSAALAAATLPLPAGGHAVAARLSGGSAARSVGPKGL